MIDSYKELSDNDLHLLQEALEKYNSRAFDEAERMFGYLSLRYSDNPEVINNYGVCLFMKGRIKDAILQFVKVLDLDPDYKNSVINIKKSFKAFFKEENIHDIVISHLDTPNISEPLKGMECFEGWAVSNSGIENIEVSVDDKFVCYAEYGLPRPDVASNYAYIKNSYHSGFRFYLNTLSFVNGIHNILVKFTAKNGVKELVNYVKITNLKLLDEEIRILETHGNYKHEEWIIDKSILLPSYISLETTIACPAKCIMCPRPAVLKKRKNTLMAESLVEKILDEVDWKCKINWEWINEPLCDDRIYKFMKRAKGLGFENWITTTGYLLDEEKSYKLLNGDVDVIVLSVDTLNEELYKKIRVGLDLKIVLNNISNLLSTKERLHSKTDIWISKIQLPPTESEKREEFIDFFKKMGIKKIQFPVYRLRGGDLDKGVKQKVPDIKKCYFIENEMAITVDGDVILCPCEAGAWVEPEANISKTSIRNAWLTPKRVETIELIRKKGLREYNNCRENTGLPE